MTEQLKNLNLQDPLGLVDLIQEQNGAASEAPAVPQTQSVVVEPSSVATSVASDPLTRRTIRPTGDRDRNRRRHCYRCWYILGKHKYNHLAADCTTKERRKAENTFDNRPRRAKRNEVHVHIH